MTQLLALIFFGLVAIWFSLRVFMTKSMVRSAFSLLAAMAAIGAMMIAMEAEFLGVLQFMMMAGEMAIMAVFMMMFMMDPGGMEAMEMTHQKKLATTLAVLSGAAVLIIGLAVPFSLSAPPAADAGQQIVRLGEEIMERSLLIFETAGVTILTTMIASTSLALVRRKKEDN